MPACVGFTNFTVLNITGLFPNFTSILQNFTTVNISSTADMVDQIYSSISDNITASIDQEFASLEP